MNYLYLGLFTAVTSCHLYASLKKNQNFRNATKGMILLTLLGFYLESVDTPSWFLVIAILMSWMGDLFLIPHGIKWFTAGGFTFGISHLFFIAAYSKCIDFGGISPLVTTGLVVLFLSAALFIFRKLKQYIPKQIIIPMFMYLMVNGLMNCFAILRMISSFEPGTIITAIGALLFFISDSSLFFVRFNKDGKLKSHFLVMLTYSLGEFLIVLGFI